MTSCNKQGQGDRETGGADPPRRLSLDLETFSSENLARASVYRYAECPDFRILLVGYSVDGEPVKTIDLESGEVLPEELIQMILSPTVLKWAFNASFERICLSRYLRDQGMLQSPRDYLPPTSWRCSMVWCGYLGLPMSLAEAGRVLGLEKQKLECGKKHIRTFSTPVQPCERNHYATRNLPSAFPKEWEEFKAYNIQDVAAEMEIQEKLSKFPVPESVWAEYEMDQKINDRGILVDRPFVRSALALDETARRELTGELSRITQIANPNSVSQMKEWLISQGMEAESLSKADVKEMMRSATPEVQEALRLRAQLAKTSTRKYESMERSACWDGRLRGMFQFYGAQRSGRWAGRNVQLQNLPQNHLPELETVRSLVASGNYSDLKLLYLSVPDVLAEVIRTAFIPAPGKKFIVCDFAAIEARVLAWLAGEKWRMCVFERGEDIYCASASAMFHVPVVKDGINGDLRQKGKVAELALGYGGGVQALIKMGALERGLTEEELQPLVVTWRNANANICRFWHEVDCAVKKAIGRQTSVPLHRLHFVYTSGMLRIELPSGRALTYPRPRLCVNRFGGESVCYMGCGTSRKWMEIESYGPKFVENIVQGISRDLLCEAMRNLSAYAIVAHVHDEVILEVDPSVSVEEVSRKMAIPPAWAPGLLLRGDGFESTFYRKG